MASSLVSTLVMFWLIFNFMEVTPHVIADILVHALGFWILRNVGDYPGNRLLFVAVTGPKSLTLQGHRILGNVGDYPGSR